MFFSILFVVTGLALLYLGAELLVRGSVSFAHRLRVSPLIIGLTIVAFGTSMPEFVVSTKTAMNGLGDIAIGNVVGSNIFNITLVLALSAAIFPLKIKIQLIRFDTPIMIASVVIFGLFFLDFWLSRAEGIFLASLLVAYIIFSYQFARTRQMAQIEDFETAVSQKMKNHWLEIGFILCGLVILVFGANSLIIGSINLARRLGLSEAVIGLTIVAGGTSLPELATSVVAALRKESDIAVGNVVGSNIFNILGILGFSALVAPIHAPGIHMTDFYVMLGTSLALLPLIFTGFILKRWEGLFLLTIYLGYLGYLLNR